MEEFDIEKFKEGEEFEVENKIFTSNPLVQNLRRQIDDILNINSGRTLFHIPLKELYQNLATIFGDQEEFEFGLFCFGNKTRVSEMGEMLEELSQCFTVDLALYNLEGKLLRNPGSLN